MKRKQLNDLVKNTSKKLNIPPELVRRYYILEKILEIISHSEYKEKFVLKGGFLIGSYIGLNNRTTVDIDTSVRDMDLSESEILSIFNKLFNVPTKENIHFTVGNIKEIREGEFYPGFRLQVNYEIDGIKDAVKLDITTGDEIVPDVILHQHKMILDNKRIEVYAYPIEQIIGEKLQTILVRSTLNTRSRDFYDVYILSTFHSDDIDYSILRTSFLNTVKSRKTDLEIDEFEEIIELISNDQRQNELWQNYSNKFSYAQGIKFERVIQSISAILQKMGFNK